MNTLDKANLATKIFFTFSGFLSELASFILASQVSLHYKINKRRVTLAISNISYLQ